MDAHDLQSLPQASMVIKHICVEGWSYIGGWTGTPLRTFLERVGADLKARYVAFKTADNYPSSIDMATALHPQTLLATQYGERNVGRPIRVSDAPAHRDQARLQESQMGDRHRGDEYVYGRLLGVAWLFMVRGHMSGFRIVWMRNVFGALVFLFGVAHAQSTTPGGMPPPPGMSLAQSAAMRFPQPVRVGDLLGRDVLRPVESQDVLGHVREVVRDSQSQILVVIDFDGFFGFPSRPIAVPVDAMVLLGQDMEVVAFTPNQLEHFPVFLSSGTTRVPDDAVIKVGLAKPSH